MRLPRLTVFTLKAGMIYLILGFTLGSLLLFHKGIPLHPILWSLLPAHINFLFFGWMVQLIMGMAFWIFPRFAQAPKRGNFKIAWLAVILLNSGIWLIVLSPYFRITTWFVLSGRFALLGSAIVFSYYVWARVKSWGKR